MAVFQESKWRKWLTPSGEVCKKGGTWIRLCGGNSIAPVHLGTCSSSWVLTTRWARSHWSATCSPPWLAGEPDRSCGCRWRRWTGLQRHSRTGSQHLWDSPPSQWCLGEEKINQVRTSFQLHTVFKKVRQEVCLPSGSDHRRSHMGPSWGTSCFLSMVRIWSSVWMDGDKPPCTQKI